MYALILKGELFDEACLENVAFVKKLWKIIKKIQNV